MSEKEFETKEGEPAAQAHNGDWLEPTVNPFGHGCCDCGLFHQVEWRLVNQEGNIVHEGFMKRYSLQLKFTRDEGETARLREHQEAFGKAGCPTEIDDNLDFHCPECESFDLEEISYLDDFGSMRCKACGYQGNPGEDFPSKKRGGLAMGQKLFSEGAATTPFCNNPKCKLHKYNVQPKILQIEVHVPSVIIGQLGRERFTRQLFASADGKRRAFFCEVCVSAIDTAQRAVGELEQE